MERQQTDNLLKSHASGTYLIRERPAEAERFAISIKYVQAGRRKRGGGRPQCGQQAASGMDISTGLRGRQVWDSGARGLG